jgi:prolyl oligopeptidase
MARRFGAGRRGGGFVSLLFCYGVLASATVSAPLPPPPSDPFGWLEDIDGPRALAWVKQRNANSAEHLTSRPEYATLYREALAVLDSAARLPEVTPHGRWLYSLWQDREHPRGSYRRASVEQFRRAEPAWETVLDVDALARAEATPWAFNGATWLTPENTRCLVRLAPGGGDAAEVREFDPERKTFVPGGFNLPTAKSHVEWRDADSLFVATDFGLGSLTRSGYPRTVKIWRRGASLDDAKTLLTVSDDDVEVRAQRIRMPEGDIDLVTESLTFWTARRFQLVAGKLEPLALPLSARVVDGFHGQLVLWLRDDWSIRGQTFPAGAVVVADPAALRGGAGRIELIFGPSQHSIVTAVDVMPGGILVSTLDDVRGRMTRLTREAEGWRREAVSFPDNGALTIAGTDQQTDMAIVKYESFLTPPSLYQVSARAGRPLLLKSQPPAFDGSRFEVQQYWATSADGTRVPYFVVAPKGLKHDGRAPVWMFSYGGFETALVPAYSGSYEALHGAYGKLWLERGGVFVLANIRGGGEFGPAWHQAALKENHYRAFEDFEAVARDIVARKITSPAHLGIEGRSNGGLLVGATMLRHPELYGAVVCGSPLLDMRRYHRLLAGASWVAEYGDPDVPDEWAYISRYSPYQNVHAGMKLPPVMFYTSTRDDRVHPGHARKMAARMDSLGYDVEYYELIEGGHHGSVTNEQLATRLARTYAFLWWKLGPAG